MSALLYVAGSSSKAENDVRSKTILFHSLMPGQTVADFLLIGAATGKQEILTGRKVTFVAGAGRRQEAERKTTRSRHEDDKKKT